MSSISLDIDEQSAEMAMRAVVSLNQRVRKAASTARHAIDHSHNREDARVALYEILRVLNGDESRTF